MSLANRSAKGKDIPAPVRRALLIASNYACVMDNTQWFVDVHHIRSREADGSHDPNNLVVLCPNCHRAADRGRIAPSALRIRKQQHEAAVAAQRRIRDSASELRDWQIYSYAESHCLDRTFDRKRRLRRSLKSLYMITLDIGRAGVIVDPNDKAPLLVLHQELIELPALEVVTTPERMIFLARLDQADPTRTPEPRLVTVDVLEFYAAAFDSNNADVRAAVDGAIQIVDGWLFELGPLLHGSKTHDR